MKMLSGKGRCALVTGARRGIGLGIAKALLAEGYRVMLCGVTAGADAASGIRDALDALGDWTYVPWRRIGRGAAGGTAGSGEGTLRPARICW